MMTTRLAVAGLLAGALAVPGTSQAGVRIGIAIGGHDDHRYGYRHNAYGMGYDRGFREGADHGHKDGRRGRGYNFWHDGRYRAGDRGYRSHYGPRWDYVAGYRRGYEAGYRRAYDGYRGRYDGYRYEGSRYYGRHRHPGRSGWCDDRHHGWNDRDWDGVIFESRPRRW
jgi:hypothetical protein